ncbi:MAG: hypothetical protein OMM_03346 [Candidatus Magnetoglobus multicellularis str. Araruama]|uniref:Uncharacterized protein n=1 Tax=Candidatus Magnetoglobus multicellularis str. Araruama TaxID=890399 RepID=A0A1V1P641_9BACT|nr:MAG: hypothetical protein OMM_03346 [Candidatus Magnetoglobus multicellularis str. Araruama]
MYIAKKHAKFIISFIVICLLPKPASSMSASSVTVKQSDNEETIIESIVWGINQNSNVFAFLSPENMLITKTSIEGFASDILVYNNYAYVANGDHGIKTFSLRNKMPQLHSTITAEYDGRIGYINRLCRHENYLFANNYKTGLFLYQIKRNGKLIHNLNQPLFKDFSPVIVDIAKWGTKLLIHTLDYKLYEYPISECISSLNLSEPELLMDDVKRFVIDHDALYYSDIKDNWQIKSLNGTSVAGEVNAYHKSIHEEKSFGDYSLIYSIQYDGSYNRRIFITMKTEPDKNYPLVYEPKDVRSFVIQDDTIYAANGFDGIAVLPCVIDAIETKVYNDNTMISKFSHTLQTSNSYQLVLFDIKEFYRFDNIDLLFSQVQGFGIGFETLKNDCLDEVCFKYEVGDVTIQIDTNEILSCELDLHYDGSESPHICPCEVKPNTKEYQLCQNKDICTHNKYRCEDLRSDTKYDIISQTKDGMTVYYEDIMISTFSEEIIPISKIVPESSTKPQSQETIKLIKGWNALSFTVIPDQKSMSLLMNESSAIFCFINQAYYAIKSVNDRIIPGAGYFIKLSKKKSISLTLTGERIENYTLVLKPGWNLIGPVNIRNDTIGIDYNLFDNKHWFNEGTYAPILKSLWEKNKAYFIKVSKECMITVPKEN